MKPITLTICGWGPYRDEQPPIDFEALGSRGLFLITGATGAGKTYLLTTNFDKMCCSHLSHLLKRVVSCILELPMPLKLNH